jgi:hypothetical protein
MVSFKLYIIKRFYYKIEIYDTLKEMHDRLKILYAIFPYRSSKDRKRDQQELPTHSAVTLWLEKFSGKNSLGLIVFCKEKFDIYFIAHEIQHALIFSAEKLKINLKMLGKRIKDDENMAYAAGRVMQNFLLEVFKRKIVTNHDLKGKVVSR